MLADDDLTDAETVISMTTNAISMNTSSMNDLEDQIALQDINSDYIFVNSNPMVLTTSPEVLAMFDLCVGETLDFHLALTDEPGVDANGLVIGNTNTVQNVALLADGVVVA